MDTRLAFYEGGHAIEEIAVPLDARGYMNEYGVHWMNRHVRDENPSIPQVHTWLKQDDSFRTNAQWPPDSDYCEPLPTRPQDGTWSRR